MRANVADATAVPNAPFMKTTMVNSSEKKDFVNRINWKRGSLNAKKNEFVFLPVLSLSFAARASFFLYIRILKSNLNVLYLLFVRWLITLNLPQSSTRFFSSFFLFNRSRRKRFSFSMSNFLSVCVVFAINKKIGHASHS